jgi:hypothetical protein
MPTALDNGQRSPRKLLRAVIARLLHRRDSASRARRARRRPSDLPKSYQRREPIERLGCDCFVRNGGYGVSSEPSAAKGTPPNIGAVSVPSGPSASTPRPRTPTAMPGSGCSSSSRRPPPGTRRSLPRWGNYKYRLLFPPLEADTPTGEETRAHRCSVCAEPFDGPPHRAWISLWVATDVLPLLVNACSEACLQQLPKPAQGYVQEPHRGGPEVKQPDPSFSPLGPPPMTRASS